MRPHGISHQSFLVYLPNLPAWVTIAFWISRPLDKKNDGTMEHPIQIPFVGYNSLVGEFETELYQFSNNHPEYKLTSYGTILEKNGLMWGSKEMCEAVVNKLDAQCVLALLMGAVRAERFCDGALLEFFKNGCILKWLKRLEDIDKEDRTIDSNGINR